MTTNTNANTNTNAKGNDMQTITTTFTAPTLDAARECIAKRFDATLDSVLITDHRGAGNFFTWALWGSAHAWGRIVSHVHSSGLCVEVTVPAPEIEYETPVLTVDKITAQQAVDMRSPRGASGARTRALPWGEQCTALLADGTPVPSRKFVDDVLLVLSGNKSAELVVAEWQLDVADVYTRTEGSRWV